MRTSFAAMFVLAATCGGASAQPAMVKEAPLARLGTLSLVAPHGRGIALSPDGRLLACGGGVYLDGGWVIWDLDKEKMVANTLSKDQAWPFGLAWSSDGKLLAAMSSSAKLQIAKLESDNFAERQTAEKELLRAGEWAAGALRATLKKPNSLEQRQRAEKLLADLKPRPVPPDTTGTIPPR